MRLHKGTAFLITVGAIMVGFLLEWIALLLERTDRLSVGALFGALVGIGTTYVGLQVANNGVRGKYYEKGIAEADAEIEGRSDDKS